MYFVDRDRIEETLLFIERQISFLKEKKDWVTNLEKAALERLCHTIIEAILDAGNAMIDGFIMRDPGSYEDIVDILTDEKVITNEMSASYKRIIDFRKMLVRHYTDVKHKELHEVFIEQLPELKQFAPKVREYLENELGPVSAFKN